MDTESQEMQNDQDDAHEGNEPEPEPDRCEACGALQLCDCRVYLVDRS